MGERQGAKVSTKTLALAAIEGRVVTFNITSDWEVTGYLCGMDDYHYRVVQPSGLVCLVHKASTPIIAIHTTPTYHDRAHSPLVTAIVDPFIDAMERQYKQKDTP